MLVSFSSATLLIAFSETYEFSRPNFAGVPEVLVAVYMAGLLNGILDLTLHLPWRGRYVALVLMLAMFEMRHCIRNSSKAGTMFIKKKILRSQF